jgi:hypothetical protein
VRYNTYIASKTGVKMRTYKAFYKGRTCLVVAESSYQAQQDAATFFKARKSYEVTVMLTDAVHDTAAV